jgi:transposase
MRLPLRVRVRGRQLIRLQNIYSQTRCARTRLRVQMVLLSHEGYSVEEIAQIARQSDDTVRHWINRFLQDGYAGLYEAPHSGRPPEITPAIDQFLLGCIPQSPRDFGLHRPTWTTVLLAKLVKRRFQIEVTEECIRRHLEQLGIVCRRPTWAVHHLAWQKPGYAQKKGLSLGY